MTQENKNILLQLLARYKALGISEQIGYDKFYLYSIITHSTAIEGSTANPTENAPIGDKIGDNPTENAPIGDKKSAILSFIAKKPSVKASVVANYIGLKASRTRDYLTELVKEGKLVAEGANKNRTYSIKK